MRYYIPSATPKYVSAGQAFRWNGNSYPSNWIQLASAADLSAIGAVAQPTIADNQILTEGANGWTITNKTADQIAAELVAKKASASAEIDAQAEAERSRYITSGSGQAMTYQEKLEEAQSFLAGGQGPFPFLSAEATAVGSTVADVAALVSATASAWRSVAAGIEGKRRGYKVQVDAATTVAAVNAILASVTWG